MTTRGGAPCDNSGAGNAAAPAAIALKGAGAKLYSAGRPGELENALRGAGVDASSLTVETGSLDDVFSRLTRDGAGAVQ